MVEKYTVLETSIKLFLVRASLAELEIEVVPQEAMEEGL